MIPPTPAIDAFVAHEGYADIQMDHILEATFHSAYREHIKMLEDVFQRDNLSYVVRRRYLWRWELKLTIPVIGLYNEEEYQILIAKLSMLASRAVVYFGGTLLKG